MDYRKAVVLFVIFGLASLILGVLLYVRLSDLSANGRSLGFGIDQTSFTTNTTSSVTCANASSGLVVAADTSRNNFKAQNTGVGWVGLCRAAGGQCDTASMFLLAPTSTVGSVPFIQDDGYTGAYSCIGAFGTTSTLNVWRN